jgi:hypothetical protein
MDRYAKAIVAALVIAYSMFNAAVGVDSPSGTGVTLNEWVGIVVATVISALGVWAVPNRPGVPTYSSPDTVTTVNVDRGPTPTPGDTWANPAPGAHERVMEDHT